MPRRLPAAFTEVLVASDGNELVKMALEHQPRLIITDRQMPGLSGPEAIARIQQTLPDTRAILVTNDDEKPEFPGPVLDKKSDTFVRDLRNAIKQELDQ